jgi:hypothetical protein
MKSRIVIRQTWNRLFYHSFRTVALNRLRRQLVLNPHRTDHANTAITAVTAIIANIEVKRREEIAIIITTHAISKIEMLRIIREIWRILAKVPRIWIIITDSKLRNCTLPDLVCSARAFSSSCLECTEGISTSAIKIIDNE